MPEGTPPISQTPQAPKKHQPMGPIIGTIIVLALLLAGALYLWGARLDARSAANQVPYIPSGTTTVIVKQ